MRPANIHLEPFILPTKSHFKIFPCDCYYFLRSEYLFLIKHLYFIPTRDHSFKWILSCNSQQRTVSPVALGRDMKAVILIVVGPGRVILHLTASLFLLLLETEGCALHRFSRFWSATWQEDCQLPVTLHATSFNKCQLFDPAANPWQGWVAVSAARWAAQCLDLASVTWGKWSKPLFCLFRDGLQGHLEAQDHQTKT